MSAEAIRKARKGKARDKFVNGDVIRWTSGGKYTYVAIKTPVGWVTSAREWNPHCPQTCNFEKLLEVLAASDVTDVEIAGSWVPINDDE